jgi:hypothetical protein
MGAEVTTVERCGADPYDSSADDDLQCCAHCGEQREYCHGHTPVIPNPTLDLPPQIPVLGSVSSDGKVRFNLCHAQATALASHLVNALDQDGQNSAEVLPPYDYRVEFARIIAQGLSIPQTIAAEGLGIRNQRGQCGGQGQGN